MHARRYIKKPVVVQVVFAKSAGQIETIEGLVSFNSGDAILTGVQKEQWPIERSRFVRDYIPMSLTPLGEDGAYQKRQVEVNAQQAQTAQKVALSNNQGVLHAKPGDWIITTDDGEQWVVAANIFPQTYELVP